MEETISRYLETDHVRIEDALGRATVSEDSIDLAAYSEFRGALLRHIGMEEKILLPAARSAGGSPIPEDARLHLDHGALAALLVPKPTPAIVAAIQAILDRHNKVEEGALGVYAQCERILGHGAPAILARLKAAPPVAMAPYNDSETGLASMRAALQRAGYSFRL
jgi:hypothetical protein